MIEPTSLNESDERAVDKKGLGLAVTASLLGSIAEWYDFTLFGAASALVLNKQFFPQFSPVIGTLLALSTFAIGFLARPIGAAIFGHFGDRIGRRTALVVTLAVMGTGTILIGLLPNYATIGVWAPVLLVCIRVIQGIAVGGEFGGAAVIVSEYAPSNRRGLYASSSTAGIAVGVLLATSAFGLAARLPDDVFQSWGWRVPFLVSVVLIVIGLLIRINLAETPVFQRLKDNNAIERRPLVVTIKKQWRTVLKIFGTRAGETMQNNIFNTFVLSYATKQLDLPASSLLFTASASGLISIVLLPVAGGISDRIGRKPIIMAGGVGCIALGIFIYPMLSVGNTWLVMIGIVGSVAIVATLMNSTLGAYLPELFGSQTRYTGASLGYQLGTVVGGISPVLVSYITSVAGPLGAAVYVVFGGVLIVIGIAMLPESVRKGRAVGLE